MFFEYIEPYEQTQPLRDCLQGLVHHVYEKLGVQLHPSANAVISYTSEMPGECWVNLHEESGPWSMRFSVSSRRHRIKLKPKSDEYISLGTNDFDEVLQEAADFADSRQLEGADASDKDPAPLGLLQQVHDDIFEADSDEANNSEEDSNQEDATDLPDSSSQATDTDDVSVQEVAAEPPEVICLSDDTEVYGSLPEESSGPTHRHLPQAPSKPQQPVRVKQELQADTQGRTGADYHVRPESAHFTSVQVKQEGQRELQGRPATQAQFRPDLAPATSQPPVQVKQEVPLELQSRVLAGSHARPDVAHTPERKRLRQTAVATEVKVEAGQAVSQQEELLTQPYTPAVKAEPSQQPQNTQIASTTMCGCGLPAACCSAPGCTAMYCRPCNRKAKEGDLSKGFWLCSLACCRQAKYCAQHRSLLKLCSGCDELCCNRASCGRCGKVICSHCTGGHVETGCAA